LLVAGSPQQEARKQEARKQEARKQEGLMAGMRVERLDHLGIVAGTCQEIGLAAYLDSLVGPSQQQVSVGTATVAMLLNGLGYSNRRLYLVAQFFATKPVGHLLGPGITANRLHDDCLGRTLDWLYDHDPTALCAGSARQARPRFGAMILNGLGFSHRRLDLLPQFFASKAEERLVGPGITAEDLNDDCLGRALDWLVDWGVSGSAVVVRALDWQRQRTAS
jgi:transposase